MFMLIERSMNEDGMMVLNSPVDFHDGEPDAERQILVSTLHHGGFKHIVGYNAGGHHFAIGSRAPIALTFDNTLPVNTTIQSKDIRPEMFAVTTDKPELRLVNTLIKPLYLYRKDPFF
jgi:hypothetical protein